MVLRYFSGFLDFLGGFWLVWVVWDCFAGFGFWAFGFLSFRGWFAGLGCSDWGFVRLCL